MYFLPAPVCEGPPDVGRRVIPRNRGILRKQPCGSQKGPACSFADMWPVGLKEKTR